MNANAPTAKPPDAHPLRLTHTRAVWLMVGVTILWSTAGVVTRHLERAASFEVTFWRSLFTAVALLVILPAWQGRAVFATIRHGGAALWVSGVCWSVMFTAFMVALTLTSTANVLVTMAVGPLLTALAARLFIGHRLPARTWVAIAVAGAGIAWMYGRQFGQGPMTGTFVALCVPLALACNWTVVQHTHRHRPQGSPLRGLRQPPEGGSPVLGRPGDAQGHDVDLVPAVLIGAALSALATLPLAWPLRTNAHDLGLLAFLGLFQLAIPCVLSVVAARVLMAPEVALLALLEVIFGIALAWAGAGEVPASSVGVGGALVVGALVVNEWLGWRRRGEAREPMS